MSRKIVTEPKRPVGGKCVRMFSHGKRISARKSAFHHKVATNDRYSFFMEKRNQRFSWGIDMGRKSQIPNCDKKVTKVTIVTFVTIYDFRYMSMPRENR